MPRKKKLDKVINKRELVVISVLLLVIVLTTFWNDAAIDEQVSIKTPPPITNQPSSTPPQNQSENHEINNQPIPPTEPPLGPPQAVDFSFTLSDDLNYEMCCGLIPSSVEIVGTAVIENTGNIIARNVKITLELFLNDGSRIKISGEDSLTRGIGDIGVGEKKNENVEFVIGLLDGYNIQNQGATAIFNIDSDEKSEKYESHFSVPDEELV